MDKAEAKVIAQEANAALDAVFAKHGLKMKRTSTTYGTGEIRLTISATSTDPALAPERAAWARYARSFDLPVDALDKVVTFKGQPVTITGLDPARRKYPVVITYPDGRKMLTTIGATKRALGLKSEPWED